MLSGRPCRLKPVALVVGSCHGSEGGMECGKGSDRVLESLVGSSECISLGKARVKFSPHEATSREAGRLELGLLPSVGLAIPSQCFMTRAQVSVKCGWKEC